MFDDGHKQVEAFDPALLRLMGFSRQIFGDLATWLLLKKAEDRPALLLGEAGVISPAPEALDLATVEEGGGVLPAEQLSPALVDLVGEREACLVAAAPVSDEQTVHGVLLLVSEVGESRGLSASEQDTFEDIARQAGLVLEREELVSALDEARAAEKSARASLAEIRGDFNLVTDQVLEVLCKTDLSGSIWMINPSAERELGYQRGELVGGNVFDLIHPEERPRAEEAFREGSVTGRFDLELRCQHRDGHFVPLVCSGAALRDDDLVPNGYLMAGRNISRRKKAEADLRRLETRFKLVWENSRDAMRLIDDDGVLIQVNDEYCRLVNMPREELLGKPFMVAYAYPDPDVKRRDFRERFRNRSIPSRLELAVKLWDGTRRVFDLSSSFFEIEDQTLLLTIYRDITERRQKEAELKRLNEALRQRAVHLGALTLKLTRVEQEERRRLAQILHDHLQQLLVAARMTMERVRRKIPEGADAATAAEVEHLLDESIEASRSITIELSPPVLHDGGLMPALDWLVRRVREKYGLVVRQRMDASAEPSSVALRLFLFQAVRELLFNCYKHARVKEVALVAERIEDERVQIVVEDKGAGFDVSEIQAGVASSRDCFGLFSLRERIDHIGGTMEIVSAPGVGTRVRLVAPLEPEVTVPSSEETETVRRRAPAGEGENQGNERPLAGRSIRLLLVDDHKIMRQGLRELFREEEDIDVVGEAENGLEGVRLALELQPDVVVMDLTMPVMNGIEATRVLAEELPEIKVIGLSMHTKEDMAQGILDAGACAYVTKATASETLVATIRDSVRSHMSEAIEATELA